MGDVDRQAAYWDKVAWDKRFSIPANLGEIIRLAPKDAKILDYGCGYGRVLAELRGLGFVNLTGVDISPRLLERGRAEHPSLDLRLFSGDRLPFADASFDAVLLMAVLTCIPGDQAQAGVMREITRVLRPGGLLFLSDFLLNDDERNQSRYRAWEGKYGSYGVFELPEGAVLRHHDPRWIGGLTAGFTELGSEVRLVPTMNGNKSKAIMYTGRKGRAETG